VSSVLAGLRVGIIGAGQVVARGHLPTLRSLGAEIVFLVDLDAAAAQLLASANGIGRVLAPTQFAPGSDACDVLLIACPYGVRAPYYQTLADKQIALMIEKPVARTERELDAIAKLAPPFAIGAGFVRRTWGVVAQLKMLLAERSFGELKHIQINFGSATGISAGANFCKNLALAGGGQLFESAIHNIDAVLYATGCDGFVVEYCEIEHESGFDLQTKARVKLSFSDRADVDLKLLVSCFRHTSNDITLQFKHACLRVSLFNDEAVKVCTLAGMPLAELSPLPGQAFARESFEAFAQLWTDFVQGWQTQQCNYTHLSSCRMTTQLIEALYARGLERNL
jgi:predicted dehydrogenase